jgi:hypothetical protein
MGQNHHQTRTTEQGLNDRLAPRQDHMGFHRVLVRHLPQPTQCVPQGGQFSAAHLRPVTTRWYKQVAPVPASELS